MIRCPFCGEQIPDDSYFCDICGKALNFCPECGKPKRGTECAACGEKLVSAAEFHNSQAVSKPKIQQPVIIDPIPAPKHLDIPRIPSATAVSDAPLFLNGGDFRLQLMEGEFGRTCGIWPELSASPYISGHHGKIVRAQQGWAIEDVGSTNGTMVNGVRLTPGQAVLIKRGDTVTIATTQFRVE